MARKNHLNYELLSSHSLSASFNSPATVIKFTDNVSYQINITTTNSVGSFSVQVSNDYAVNPMDPQDITNPGTWDTLTLSGTPTVNSANDVIVISLNQLPYDAIRLAYTSSVAGTGVCTAYLTSKQIGG